MKPHIKLVLFLAVLVCSAVASKNANSISSRKLLERYYTERGDQGFETSKAYLEVMRY
jgi:hypothetical protein